MRTDSPAAAHAIAWALLCCCTAGCGSAPATAGADCKPLGFQMLLTDDAVSPDHLAPPPANQQAFRAGLGSTYGPDCISNQLYAKTDAQWSTSDAANVSISSRNDATNGVATCTGATSATVTATLTAYGFTEMRSAPIVCK